MIIRRIFTVCKVKSRQAQSDLVLDGDHLGRDVHPGHPLDGVRQTAHDLQHLPGDPVGSDGPVTGGNHGDLISLGKRLSYMFWEILILPMQNIPKQGFFSISTSPLTFWLFYNIFVN